MIFHERFSEKELIYFYDSTYAAYTHKSTKCIQYLMSPEEAVIGLIPTSSAVWRMEYPLIMHFAKCNHISTSYLLLCFGDKVNP